MRRKFRRGSDIWTFRRGYNIWTFKIWFEIWKNVSGSEILVSSGVEEWRIGWIWWTEVTLLQFNDGSFEQVRWSGTHHGVCSRKDVVWPVVHVDVVFLVV